MTTRREFITLLGGAAAEWPIAARPQQPALPVIGFLNSRSRSSLPHLLPAFRQGLKETGFVEGENLSIEFRFADGQYDKLPALAAELVQRRVAVIAVASTIATIAAKQATQSIPIVFFQGGDPIKLGFVASLHRPSANITGASFLTDELVQKRFEVLHELLPRATMIGLLVNPSFSTTEAAATNAQIAAATFGIKVVVAEAVAEGEFEPPFGALVRQGAQGLLVAPDPYFNSQATAIVALAARHALPAMYQLREYVAADGLMSYGTNLSDVWRLGGSYVGRILKGEKAADLPVQQSTRVELVINLKTARALGLEVPPTLLARADEVIE
jgi:putative tryptophan/tyrosine transport system substrate-binding protein